MTLFLIMGLAFMLVVTGYCYFKICSLVRFYGICYLKKWMKVLIITISFVLGGTCLNIWSTGVVVVLHFIAAFIMIDCITLLISGIFKKKRETKSYQVFCKILKCGVLPILIVAMVMIYGFYNMGSVRKTEYFLTTDKEIRKYKIALITDTHYGTIQDSKVLRSKVNEINLEHPDIIILAGDISEEGTSKEKMKELFEVLGSLESNYGIYYVYGNHDRQPYTTARTYTDKELDQAIEENGIHILKDVYKEINDDLILAGRDDAAWGNNSGRKSSEEILKGVNRDKYIIMVDHQPIGVEENEKQGVDLELSGHTHAGQIWPVGILSQLTGTLNYGLYQKGDCNVIVSAGFAGWGYSLRTEEHCEYNIIHISGK